MEQKTFILDARTGNALEHKTATVSEMKKAYNSGLIVGVEKDNVRQYIIPAELCKNANDDTVLVNGVATGKRGRKAKNLERDFPNHIIIITTLSEAYSTILAYLNETSMVFYSKKLYELDAKIEARIKAEKAAALAKQKKEYEGEIAKLKEEIDANKGTAGAITALESNLDELQKKYDAAKKDLKNKTALLKTAEETSKELETKGKKAEAEKEKISEDLEALKLKYDKRGETVKDLQQVILDLRQEKAKLIADQMQKDKEIEGLKAEIEQKTQKHKSEQKEKEEKIDLLSSKVSTYEAKEKKHKDNIKRAREEFKQNWVGKGRQPSIKGKDKEQVIIQMRNDGVKIMDIAKYIGCSKVTVSTILKANGMTRPYNKRQ